MTEAKEGSFPAFGTIKDAADRFGISQTTVRRYINEGRITAHRMGPRLIRLDLNQVEQEIYQSWSAS